MKIKGLLSAVVALIVSLVVATSCSPKPLYERVDALDDSAWEVSKWISAVDAEVIPDTIRSRRAADGASWFVSTLKNEKRVVSAKWMTAGLGVFDLYVNGNRIGDEVLKPGYTSPTKTKLSFTYDVTRAFETAENAENTLAVQVTPGWWADRIVTSQKKGFRLVRCWFTAKVQKPLKLWLIWLCQTTLTKKKKNL